MTGFGCYRTDWEIRGPAVAAGSAWRRCPAREPPHRAAGPPAQRKVRAVAGQNTGGQRFAGDDGKADPRVAAILAGYAAGQLVFLPTMATRTANAGWRTASLVLVGTVLALLPVIAILMREATTTSASSPPPWGKLRAL